MPTFTYKGASWTYNEVTGPDSRTWMDRDLGATQVATSLTDTASYGDLFQWGRLDDGHQTPTSGTTGTKSTGDVPGNSNFITGSADWRSTQNNNLWQSGLNVPAPTGWHVPTSAEWSTLVTGNITNSATAYSSSLKLPVAGNRNYSVGGLGGQGTYGDYWSSSVTGTNAYRLYFTSSSAYPANVDRSEERRVRQE